jgi:hypothetical protein
MVFAAVISAGNRDIEHQVTAKPPSTTPVRFLIRIGQEISRAIEGRRDSGGPIVLVDSRPNTQDGQM